MNARVPLIIRGVHYPNRRAAALAMGISLSGLDEARAGGRLDELGLGRRAHPRMPIRVRGVVYSNAAEAAKALRVTNGAIFQAMLCNRLDRVGVPPAYNHARSIPFVMAGLSWPSIRAASIDLGFKPEYIHAATRRGHKRGMERIIAAVMVRKAALDAATARQRRRVA